MQDLTVTKTSLEFQTLARSTLAMPLLNGTTKIGGGQQYDRNNF